MVLDYLSYRRFHKPIPAGVLLLNCGLHDIKRESQLSEPKISLASYKKNLRASLQVAKEMNLHVVWVNTTPVCDAWHNSGIVNFFRFSKDVDAFNAAANEVMKREHIPVIDLHRFTMTLLPDGLQDHVHYSETARSRQARFLFDELRQILKLGLHEIVSA